MPETLRSLSNDYKLAIVSSNSTADINQFLKQHNIEVFDYVYGGGGIFGKHNKIKKCIKHFKFQKDEAIYIGDEVRDIEAAHKAGCKSIAVTWGFQPKKVLEASNPHELAQKPEEISHKLHMISN
jgi:phosphoglycolate phosphatase